jgi:hypothetical protein
MMKGVSRTLFPRLLAVVALAGALFAGRFAVAQGASLEDLLAGALTPSVAPGLLGPITSAGRIGWECKPERAAAAAPWRHAELPSEPQTP